MTGVDQSDRTRFVFVTRLRLVEKGNTTNKLVPRGYAGGVGGGKLNPTLVPEAREPEQCA